MSAAHRVVAGRIPGERIATTEITSDSATFTTTETQVGSVTAELVAGRTYKIKQYSRWHSDAAGDVINVRIRDDDVDGSFRGSIPLYIPEVNSFGWPCTTESEFTASVTGHHTFVLTGDRLASGSGTCMLAATGGSRPSYLYVEYVRG